MNIFTRFDRWLTETIEGRCRHRVVKLYAKIGAAETDSQLMDLEEEADRLYKRYVGRVNNGKLCNWCMMITKGIGEQRKEIGFSFIGTQILN